MYTNNFYIAIDAKDLDTFKAAVKKVNAYVLNVEEIADCITYDIKEIPPFLEVTMSTETLHGCFCLGAEIGHLKK